MTDERHIVLVGLMGSGKSTIGRIVARRLGRPFVDLDVEIARAASRSIPDIFSREGEPGFRIREHAALVDALGHVEPSVIATGGGAVLSVENRLLMRTEGIVVWLRAEPATLERRVGDGRGRPVLGSDPAGTLAALAVAREPAYASAAHAVVDVDAEGTEAIGELVVRAVGPTESGARSPA